MTGPTPEARGKVAAARRANIDATPTTTRPGSETTTLTVGDPVRCHREGAHSQSWSRYEGREGWVTSINHQTFPDGSTYVEVGVSFLPSAATGKRGTDTWFRADELEPA
jgi:hypothetical protein